MFRNMGCHPSNWRTPSFSKMVIAPPISYDMFLGLIDFGGICWIFMELCGIVFVFLVIFMDLYMDLYRIFDAIQCVFLVV